MIVENKRKAEILFNRTKRAYEVLSDPHKRAIYDSLGVRGLETEGWEIVHRTKTPSEIREEYEQLARERAERKLQQRTNPRGNITINVNATDIFNPYDDEFEYVRHCAIAGETLISVFAFSSRTETGRFRRSRCRACRFRSRSTHRSR